MADYDLKINENMIYGLLDDQVVRGLEGLANSVADMARELAPVGKRTRAKPRDLDLELRKVENRPIGKHDYVRPQLEGKPYELDPDVHRYIMGQLRKHESGLYEVRATVPSLNRRGKTTDYPLMNARAVSKAGEILETGRDPISDKVVHERSSTPSKLVTGRRLKDSIFVEMIEAGEATWTAQVIADRPYAWYVEKGLGPGKGRTPAYFMEGALAAHAEIIESGDILKR